MKKVLRNALATLLLGIVCQAANDEFRYTLKVNDASVYDSCFVFGRSAEATDGIDTNIDVPAIPNVESAIPYAYDLGPVDDFYFRSQVSIAGESDTIDTAYEKLSIDIRDASRSATTWTLCTYSNDVQLSWEGKYYDEDTRVTINSPLADGNGELKLCDSSNKVLIADMRTTTSYTLKANSVYNIKYIGNDAVSEAPETPEEITDEFVVVSGASSVFDILDVTKYTLVDWTLCFYYVAGQDYFGKNILKKFATKDIKMSDNNPNATYDPETGKFTYTYTDDFDHKLAEFRLLYSYKYANPTRGNDDNAGIATGMLRSVVADLLIKLDENSKENEINVNGEASEKTAVIKYTVTTAEKLNLYGDFTLPPWAYKEGKCTEDPWTAVFKVDGKVVEPAATVASSENGGPTTIQFTAAKPLVKLDEDPSNMKDITVTIELTGNKNCKDGSVVFTPKYVTFDDNEKTGDALTANVKVKGLANLDIDGNGIFNTFDVRLIFNYATVGRNNTAMMTKGIPTSLKLAGREAELKAKIEEMIDELDIDGNGIFNTFDVRLIFNYATVGRNNTSMMTKGIPASLKLVGREEELKAIIEAMIE